jgi:hypothetical protein
VVSTQHRELLCQSPRVPDSRAPCDVDTLSMEVAFDAPLDVSRTTTQSLPQHQVDPCVPNEAGLDNFLGSIVLPLQLPLLASRPNSVSLDRMMHPWSLLGLVVF